MFQDPEISDASGSLMSAIETAHSVMGRDRMNDNRQDTSKQMETFRAASQKKIKGLQSQLKILAAEKDTAQQELAALRVAIDTKEGDTTDVTKLKLQLAAMEKVVKSTQQEKDETQSNLDQLRGETQEKDRQIDELQKSLMKQNDDAKSSQLKTKISDLTADAIRREKMIDVKNETIKRLQEEVAAVNEECSTHRCVRAALESKLSNNDANSSVLEASVQSKTALIESLQKELIEQRHKMDKLQQHVSTVETQRENLLDQNKQTVHDFQSTIRELQKDIADKNNALSTMKNEIASRAAIFEEQSQQMNKKKRLVSALSSMSASTQALNSTMHVRRKCWIVWRSFAASNRSSRISSMLKNANDALNEEKARAAKKAAELEEVMLEKHRSTSALKADLDSKDRHVSSLENEIKLLQGTVSRIQQESGDTESKYHKARTQLEEVLTEKQRVLFEKQELQRKLDQQIAENERHVERNENLQRLREEDTRHAQEKIESLERNMKESQSESEKRLSTRIEVLEEELRKERDTQRSLKKFSDEAHKMVGETKASQERELEELRSRNRTLELSIAKLDSDFHENREKTMSSYDSELERLQGAVKGLEAENRVLQAELLASKVSMAEQGSAQESQAVRELRESHMAQLQNAEEEKAALSAQIDALRSDMDAAKSSGESNIKSLVEQLAASYASGVTEPNRALQDIETINHLLCALEAEHKREVEFLRSQSQTVTSRREIGHASSSMAHVLQKTAKFSSAAVHFRKWMVWSCDRRTKTVQDAADKSILLMIRKRDELQNIAQKAIAEAKQLRKAQELAKNRSVPSSSIGVQCVSDVSAKKSSSLMEAARVQMNSLSGELRASNERERELVNQVSSLSSRNQQLSVENSKLKNYLQSGMDPGKEATGGEAQFVAESRKQMIAALERIVSQGEMGNSSQAAETAKVALRRGLSDVEIYHSAVGLQMRTRPSDIVCEEKSIAKI